jgi:RHS repeat-associated protein
LLSPNPSVNANRLDTLALPNNMTSDYTYDDTGRLTHLTQATATGTLASYEYSLDNVGSRRILTETLNAVLDLPSGTFLEDNGLVTVEAENGQVLSGTTHAWLTATAISGYTGTSYLHALPDNDTLYPTEAITGSPRAEYRVNFTNPGTYTVWVRGYADNADADAVNVGLNGEVVGVTGFPPDQWAWANTNPATGQPVTVTVQSSGLYTLTAWLAEDGFRLDRVLLTTDTTFMPTGFGPAESEITSGGLPLLVDRVIDYDYDDLYRLTEADYSTGELYEYDYDPVGNRLQQIINGDTTSYQYDEANRISQVNGQSYSFDPNGNLLETGIMTNTWDAANRLVGTTRDTNTLQPIYNGVGDRVGQTEGGNTTYFALDIQGLPEVIQTSDDNSYLHLPGVIVAENASGETRYLLSDGLGSVRQAVDETAAVVASYEFDPYGNPVDNMGGEPYGYTGEWWGDEVELLHLRARWYLPSDGVFLSKDAWEGDELRPLTLNGWSYVQENPVNFIDPTGYTEWRPSTSWVERIIERVHEAGRPEIHLEYSMPLGRWRPDILHSYTGEVFEIKPLLPGGVASILLAHAEAGIYATALNSFKSNTILGGSKGLLPQNAPNDWNSVDWHRGSPSSFPPLFIPGQTPIPTAYGSEYINAPFDLVAFSSVSGSVVWYFQPKPQVPATLLAAYLAKEFWSKYVQGAQALKQLQPACPVIVVPEIFIDPTNPNNPLSPYHGINETDKT